jgi:hypothetical protein
MTRHTAARSGAFGIKLCLAGKQARQARKLIKLWGLDPFVKKLGGFSQRFPQKSASAYRVDYLNESVDLRAPKVPVLQALEL